MSSTTVSIVSEIKRLKGAWIFRGWAITIAWNRDAGKWWIGMRHKRREEWSTELLVPEAVATEIARKILAAAEEVTSGKLR